MSRQVIVSSPARDVWKREEQEISFCICSSECREACHNAIMHYECDHSNCKLVPERCGNRPFAELESRKEKEEPGVKVMETDDRGHGLQATISFEHGQPIVEYVGEVVTRDEARIRRMTSRYLLQLSAKLYIDAEKFGNKARFVNHSCNPNCEIIAYIVGGKLRMALFAGPRGISIEEELTFDYNYEPFSFGGDDKCRCGAENCRGTLSGLKYRSSQRKCPFKAGLKRYLQSRAKAWQTNPDFLTRRGPHGLVVTGRYLTGLNTFIERSRGRYKRSTISSRAERRKSNNVDSPKQVTD